MGCLDPTRNSISLRQTSQRSTIFGCISRRKRLGWMMAANCRLHFICPEITQPPMSVCVYVCVCKHKKYIRDVQSWEKEKKNRIGGQRVCRRRILAAERRPTVLSFPLSLASFYVIYHNHDMAG